MITWLAVGPEPVVGRLAPCHCTGVPCVFTAIWRPGFDVGWASPDEVICVNPSLTGVDPTRLLAPEIAAALAADCMAATAFRMSDERLMRAAALALPGV